MKLSLDYEIPIQISEKGKEKESLSVFYREPTKGEKKERDTLLRKFKKLNTKISKLQVKGSISEKRIQAYFNLDKNEKALIELEKQEKYSDDLDALLEEMEKIGGDDYAETQSKKNYEKFVNGKDKDKLKEYAEIKGYASIMNSLNTAKEAIVKKQSGE